MNYKIVSSLGCTANCIQVNGEVYSPNNEMGQEKTDHFHEAILAQIRCLFDQHRIGVGELLTLLDVENVEYSETCETCGDNVVTTYYEEFKH